MKKIPVGIEDFKEIINNNKLKKQYNKNKKKY